MDGNLIGLEGSGASSVKYYKGDLVPFGRHALLIYGNEIAFMKLE